MFEPEWDAGLDEAQLAAAAHDGGPLVIVAGAGTGKTRTLTARVARLLAHGADPSRILLLTFTRRAAADMLARAGVLCGDRRAAGRLWGGTFHAVAHQLITRYPQTLGLPAEFTVLDQADAADLMDLLRHEHDLAGTGQRLPRADTLVDAYTRAVNTAQPAREVLAVEFPWCEPHVEKILELYRGYMARKRADGLLDFDDLLLAWRALLTDETLGPAIRGRWDHVLVDEYQDVNQIQVDIVRLLCADGAGLTVVGDDAQAIYAFRGADPTHLTDLAITLPDVTVIRLERNFRSRQPLLDLANTIRPESGGMPPLRLHSDQTGGPRPTLMRCYDAPTEARLVADAVLDDAESGRRLRDQAVLMRAAHHSDLLEIELTTRRVPFRKYGGLRFLEAAHVKDFLAALRLLDNRADEIAWYRLLRLHDGIGPARARALLGVLNPAAGPDEHRHAEAVAAAPAAARVKLGATLAALADARAQRTPAERATSVVAMLRPLLMRRYPDHPARLADLDRLLAATASAPTLAEYVAAVTLDPPAATSDLAGPPQLDDDYLTLSTVHSAKGLEWDVVHVIGLVDGAFPSDMALNSRTGLVEEQRLFYVALTRARTQLHLYVPQRMHVRRFGGSDRYCLAPDTRFLTDTALVTLDVHQAEAPAPSQRVLTTSRVAVPTLDDLWT
ncbi:MAG TPA: ATP-dependent helicase [Jatrophihabitantaceae bacterium]|jgi:DNA helicase-2/ATP-dependent DNA helicase PcrA